MNQHPHFIIIRLSAMGDVAMIVPTVRALSAQHPNAKITVVSRLFFKPFFQEIPRVAFFAFDEKGRHKGFFRLLFFFADLLALKADYYIDLHDVLRTKIIGFFFRFTSTKTAVTDKKRHEKKAITAATKINFARIESVFEKQVNALKRVGVTIDLNSVAFPPKVVLSDHLKTTFKIDYSKKIIGIAPFAQYQSKVYPLDLMQNTVDKLAEKANHNLLLFGGGHDEILLLNQLAKNHQNVRVVAGKISFQEELWLISNLDVMLSMDSGNAHIAAMLGVKVVTLWGATHPFAGFSPFGQSLENCLVADRNKYPQIPTSVYGNKDIKGYEDAMRTILPVTVVSKIESLLSR